MTLSSRHIYITLFIALLLHIAVGTWFSITEEKIKSVAKTPIKINLLATIADEAVNAAPKKTLPKKIKPPIKEKKPKPIKKKIVKKISAKPKPKFVKTPQPKPEPLEKIVEAETIPEVTQPAPAISKPLNAIATARYEQLLVAWLEKHKKYPRRAKRLRIEGEGQLLIIINRTGHTQQVSLKQRTGNRLLDKAALEMVQRANPFPAIPKSDPRKSLEFIVPVAFLLN